MVIILIIILLLIILYCNNCNSLENYTTCKNTLDLINNVIRDKFSKLGVTDSIFHENVNNTGVLLDLSEYNDIYGKYKSIKGGFDNSVSDLDSYKLKVHSMKKFIPIGDQWLPLDKLSKKEALIQSGELKEAGLTVNDDYKSNYEGFIVNNIEEFNVDNIDKTKLKFIPEMNTYKTDVDVDHLIFESESSNNIIDLMDNDLSDEGNYFSFYHNINDMVSNEVNDGSLGYFGYIDENEKLIPRMVESLPPWPSPPSWDSPPKEGTTSNVDTSNGNTSNEDTSIEIYNNNKKSDYTLPYDYDDLFFKYYDPNSLKNKIIYSYNEDDFNSELKLRNDNLNNFRFNIHNLPTNTCRDWLQHYDEYTNKQCPLGLSMDKSERTLNRLIDVYNLDRSNNTSPYYLCCS